MRSLAAVLLLWVLATPASAEPYPTIFTLPNGNEIEIELGDPRSCAWIEQVAAARIDEEAMLRARHKVEIASLKQDLNHLGVLALMLMIGIGTCCTVIGGLFWPRPHGE